MSADYILPDVTGMLIMPDGGRTAGTLRELLTIYATMDQADRKRSSILLDQPISTPPNLRDLDGKGSRLNIFDGEGEELLRFL